jgi:hypothetical protein
VARGVLEHFPLWHIGKSIEYVIDLYIRFDWFIGQEFFQFSGVNVLIGQFAASDGFECVSSFAWFFLHTFLSKFI